MSTNIQVLIYSIVIGIAHVTYIFFRPQCQGEGLSCMAIDMGPILLGVVGVPIIFGVLGSFFSKEKRFRRGMSWFGISFAVLFVLNVMGGELKEKLFPRDQSQNYAPCLPDYTGTYTCEEWQNTYPDLQRKKY